MSACSFSTLRLNLVLTHGIAPDVHGGVHIFPHTYYDIKYVQNTKYSTTTAVLYGHVLCLYKKKLASVCVCFLPIHSGHQVRWTYQPGSHRRKVTQDFLIHLPSAVRALIFVARRIQPFLSLVGREVEFCVLTN